MTSLVFSHDGERLLAGADDTVTTCSLTATPKVEDSLQPLFAARFVSADPQSLIVAAITSNNGVQVRARCRAARMQEDACQLTAGRAAALWIGWLTNSGRGAGERGGCAGAGEWGDCEQRRRMGNGTDAGRRGNLVGDGDWLMDLVADGFWV